MKTLLSNLSSSLLKHLLSILILFSMQSLVGQEQRPSLYWHDSYLEFSIQYNKAYPDRMILVLSTKSLPSNYYISAFTWDIYASNWLDQEKTKAYISSEFNEINRLEPGNQYTFYLEHMLGDISKLRWGGNLFLVTYNCLGCKADESGNNFAMSKNQNLQLIPKQSNIVIMPD